MFRQHKLNNKSGAVASPTQKDVHPTKLEEKANILKPQSPL
jgi:hypothetical protein